MMKTPNVEFDNIRLTCPDCGEVLDSNICKNCGCVINTAEFQIDIQPEEILDVILYSTRSICFE